MMMEGNETAQERTLDTPPHPLPTAAETTHAPSSSNGNGSNSDLVNHNNDEDSEETNNNNNNLSYCSSGWNETATEQQQQQPPPLSLSAPEDEEYQPQEPPGSHPMTTASLRDAAGSLETMTVGREVQEDPSESILSSFPQNANQQQMMMQPNTTTWESAPFVAVHDYEEEKTISDGNNTSSRTMFAQVMSSMPSQDHPAMLRSLPPVLPETISSPASTAAAAADASIEPPTVAVADAEVQQAAAVAAAAATPLSDEQTNAALAALQEASILLNQHHHHHHPQQQQPPPPQVMQDQRPVPVDTFPGGTAAPQNMAEVVPVDDHPLPAAAAGGGGGGGSTHTREDFAAVVSSTGMTTMTTTDSVTRFPAAVVEIAPASSSNFSLTSSTLHDDSYAAGVPASSLPQDGITKRYGTRKRKQPPTMQQDEDDEQEQQQPMIEDENDHDDDEPDHDSHHSQEEHLSSSGLARSSTTSTNHATAAMTNTTRRSAPKRVSWEDRMEMLQRYKQEHGDLLIPIRYKQNPSLGKFVHNTREQYKLFHKRTPEGYKKKCSLTAERIAQLDDIGFVWSTERTKRQNEDWEGRLEQLKEYKKEHGVRVCIGRHMMLPTWCVLFACRAGAP